MNIIRLIFASGALALSLLPANAEQHLAIAVIAEVPDSALEGVKLGAGDGWADSSDAAAQSALSECNQENNTSHCLIGGSFRYGQCGYVAIGAGVVEGGQRVVSWGTGETDQQALNACISNGVGQTSCRLLPKGGCTTPQ